MQHSKMFNTDNVGLLQTNQISDKFKVGGISLVGSQIEILHLFETFLDYSSAGFSVSPCRRVCRRDPGGY